MNNTYFIRSGNPIIDTILTEIAHGNFDLSMYSEAYSALGDWLERAEEWLSQGIRTIFKNKYNTEAE